MTSNKLLFAVAFLIATLSLMTRAALADDTASIKTAPKLSLQWNRLPDLPDELGVAGPFVGMHRDALIVAGGANFHRPVWESTKVWRDRIHVLTKSNDGYVWHDGGKLARPIAYGAAVSTPYGVICIGGNDSGQTFRDVFALQWDQATRQVTQSEYPPLPQPCAFGQAVCVEGVVYLAGGQCGNGLDSAMKNFWALDLAKRNQPDEFHWQELEPWPGEARALDIAVAQRNGDDMCVYVISGRRQVGEYVHFLNDVWEYNPRTGTWQRRADLPQCVMAGTGAAVGTNQIVILGGDDGSLFFKADELKDKHPGFARQAFAYDTSTDLWTSAGPIPRNHVTTIPVVWDNHIIIVSGEVRPRVRTPAVWSIQP